MAANRDVKRATPPSISAAVYRRLDNAAMLAAARVHAARLRTTDPTGEALALVEPLL